MNRKPLISVIIPMYQAAPFLQDAVGSLLRQPRAEVLQILCVDDGSEDNTLPLCRSAFDERVERIALPHKGVSHARNAGLERAKGEYVAFLDADDLWTEGFLDESLVNRMQSGAEVFGFGSAVQSPEPSRNSLSVPAEGQMNGGYEAVKTGQRHFGSFFWRKDLLQRHGLRFPEGIQANEDEVLRTLCLYRAESVEWIGRVLYINRLRPGSLRSFRYSPTGRIHLMEAWKYAWEAFSGEAQMQAYCAEKMGSLLDKMNRESCLDEAALDLAAFCLDTAFYRAWLHRGRPEWLQDLHGRKTPLVCLGERISLAARFGKGFFSVLLGQAKAEACAAAGVACSQDWELLSRAGAVLVSVRSEKALARTYRRLSRWILKNRQTPCLLIFLLEGQCAGELPCGQETLLHSALVCRRGDKLEITAEDGEAGMAAWDIMSCGWPGRVGFPAGDWKL